MTADDEVVTDLTADTTLVEGEDAELFANLTRQAVPRPRSQPPPHRVSERPPSEKLRDVARLGALMPRLAAPHSVPPSFNRRRSTHAPSVIAVPSAMRTPTVAPVVLSMPPAAQIALNTGAGVGPATESVPPRPKRTLRLAAAAVAALGVLALIALVFAARLVGAPGTLLVTVSAPGASEVTGIEVLVDGQMRCASSPCRVTGVDPGTHLVKVRGRGFQETASLAVSVEPRTQGALDVALSRASAPPQAAAAVAAPPLEQAKVHDDARSETRTSTLGTYTTPAPPPPARTSEKRASSARVAVAAPAASAKPANEGDASATLRIVSLPVSSVLIDGRPIGHTPQVVRIPPGSHRVALLGKDDQREQVVDVAAGETRVVSVRF